MPVLRVTIHGVMMDLGLRSLAAAGTQPFCLRVNNVPDEFILFVSLEINEFRGQGESLSLRIRR